MTENTDNNASGDVNRQARKKRSRRRPKRNTDVVTNNPDSETAAKNQPQGSRMGAIALVGVIILAVVMGFLHHRHSQVMNTLSDSESVRADAIQKLGEVQKSLSSSLGELQQQQMDANQNQLAIQETLAALDKEQPDDQLDWALMEAEYLVVIAMHRLMLERDVKTAITALESADRRLLHLANPSLIPVREQLARDIASLKSVNQVDTTGMVLYISSLITEIDKLPLQQKMQLANDAVETSETAPQQTSAFSRLPALIWQELKSLVVIKHKDEEGTRFLLPEQEYYVYQNLRLQLETAKLAILDLDSATLSANIELIVDWLDRHFDGSQSAVSNMQEALLKMQSVNLKPELPQLNSSLETIRAVMRDNLATESGS